MHDESIYERFLLSEHQIIATTNDPEGQSAEESTKRVDVNSDINDVERNRIVRLIIRKVLNQAPFPTKYEDIRLLIKQNVSQTYNHNLFNLYVEDAKKMLMRVFGLILCDVKYGQGKREFFLKQSIAFPPHDLKILSEGDHELRGFLLILLPLFKAYSNSIQLNRLCESFQKFGLGHMVPKSAEDEEAFILRLKSIKRRKEIKYSSKEFSTLSDYILYAKDLGYLTLKLEDKGDTLATIFILPGYRLLLEHNKDEYIQHFKKLDEETFSKGLEIFFE
ncbi:conserved hypothetical protein [Theileria equi strain WA]|uniref:Uncharacterized protein n=1 Tax=Theileria equi strain WA TaxID=1537102 RepID=L1LC83_THEEQ|nr:conserved hypothetical protein [Theileria equi strain WA]EKX72889.1 conserved hypothetical protein [Theileria equi strain WA]|eukprot:XP_004832341.1 conserved hypothetical protein [Theileria equi strain WA]